MSSCQKNTVAVLAFFDQQIKKAQLPAIRITERPIESQINRTGIINFLSIFAKNGLSKLVLVLVQECDSKRIFRLV